MGPDMMTFKDCFLLRSSDACASYCHKGPSQRLHEDVEQVPGQEHVPDIMVVIDYLRLLKVFLDYLRLLKVFLDYLRLLLST